MIFIMMIMMDDGDNDHDDDKDHDKYDHNLDGCDDKDKNENNNKINILINNITIISKIFNIIIIIYHHMHRNKSHILSIISNQERLLP